jgi:hypothetical protein
MRPSPSSSCWLIKSNPTRTGGRVGEHRHRCQMHLRAWERWLAGKMAAPASSWNQKAAGLPEQKQPLQRHGHRLSRRGAHTQQCSEQSLFRPARNSARPPQPAPLPPPRRLLLLLFVSVQHLQSSEIDAIGDGRARSNHPGPPAASTAHQHLC